METSSMLSNGILIRPAQREDAERIWQIRIESIQTLCAADYSSEQLQGWVGKATPDRYREIVTEGRESLIVAETAAQVVGYASLCKAEIYAVHVDPGYARQGIGGRLLAAIEAEAAKTVLALTVDASLTAIPFYQSQGYEILEYTQHQLRSGVQIPCVRMRKQLH
jgi:ribosomal protein S18 acetylase RimI-like enzyme